MTAALSAEGSLQQSEDWSGHEYGIPPGRCSDSGMGGPGLGAGYVPWSTPDPNSLPLDLDAPKKSRGGFGSSLRRAFRYGHPVFRQNQV
jgi:hypothetical protein